MVGVTCPRTDAVRDLPCVVGGHGWVLLGEPLREGKKAGVPMPTLEVLYQLARTIQWRTKEAKGLVQLPGK